MSVFDWKARTLRVVGEETIIPSADTYHSPNGRRRIYLLVHGFNNTPDKAGKNYTAFRERLETAIGSELTHEIWEFYWPGYEEGYAQILTLRTGREPASPLVTAYFYYKQVPKAIRYGKLLGDYILQLRTELQETEVILIGHSLGCRLILEALSHIEPHAPRWKVPAVLLMAAAVPESAVVLGGALRAGVEFSPYRFALFSHRDSALWGCFPAGQLLAGDGGPAPKAVGWRGGPEGCWTGRQSTQLSHGEYWENDVTTPNVARVFGRATPHRLPAFVIVPWVLAQPPVLPAWRLPTRIQRR
jgi:pimeloyl-ACP methyl ester carboxylesterase